MYHNLPTNNCTCFTIIYEEEEEKKKKFLHVVPQLITNHF